MKTNFLRLLTAVAVVCISSSVFADGVDVTEKLVNPDGSDGLQGWTVDFTIGEGFTGYTWASNSHTERAYGDEGYWGMSGRIFELWNSNQTIPGPTSIYQDLTGLPNGTYVFGAFSLAVQSGYDKNDAEGYTQSTGGYMFANADEIPVATNAPFDGIAWAHGRKFNIATTVTDGTLRVGMSLKENPTCFWMAFDNATLYYFGDATTEAALQEMHKIDVDCDILVTDSLKKYSMSAECYADLVTSAEYGRAAKTLDEYEAADDSIRCSCTRARRSIVDFKSLENILATAKDVVAGEWSDMVTEQIRILNKNIEQTEKALKNYTITNDALNEVIATLTNDMDMVRVDQLWDVLDQLSIFIREPDQISVDNPLFGITQHPGFGSEMGQYSMEWLDKLEALYEETNALLADIEAGIISPTVGFEQVSVIQGAVSQCINSASQFISLPYELVLIGSEGDPNTPIESSSSWNNSYFVDNYRSENGLTNGGECLHVESPVLYLNEKISMIQISVMKTVYQRYASTNDGPYFAMGEFYLFDGEGNRIDLSESNLSVNTIDPSYPEKNLVDGDLNTICHSRWSGGHDNYGPHILTISLPEPLSAFSFIYESAWDGQRLHVAPAQVRISGMSAAKGELAELIANAEKYNFTVGKDPGFYGDVDAGFAAELENAKQVLEDPASTPADYSVAVEKLSTLIEKNKDKTFNQPEEGKEYTISCKYGNYLAKQKAMKALSVMEDSVAWWENADMENRYQRWTFESAENTYGDNEVYYYIKNAQTGTYLGSYCNEPGYDAEGNAFSWSGSWWLKMSEEPVAWRLSNIGSGQFNLITYSYSKQAWLTLHTDSHNNGNPSENQCNHLGYSGVSGALTYWGDQTVNGYSAWAINQMEALPLTTLVGDGSAQKCYHFATGNNIFAFMADKACSFANFKMYDECMNEIAIQTRQAGNVLTVTLPGIYADFYFSFDNAEGVQNMTINVSSGEKTKIDLLQEAYDAALQDYVEGTDVGCIKDLSTYYKAMENAELLLTNGGTDDEIVAAIAAVDEALANLETVQPETDKRYFIVSANSDNMNRFGAAVAACYFPSIGKPGWSMFKNSEEFMWEFVPTEVESQWLLKNVSCGQYLGHVDGFNKSVEMSEVGSPYEILVKDNGQVLIHCVVEGNKPSWDLHQNGWNGSQSFKDFVYWEDCAMSRWYIREVDNTVSIKSLLSEPSKVGQEGIYDLFGRRVAAPEKGIYIVNGKKTIIK